MPSTRSRRSAKSSSGEVVANVILQFRASREANTQAVNLPSPSRPANACSLFSVYNLCGLSPFKASSSPPIPAASASCSNPLPTNLHSANPSPARWQLPDPRPRILLHPHAHPGNWHSAAGPSEKSHSSDRSGKTLPRSPAPLSGSPPAEPPRSGPTSANLPSASLRQTNPPPAAAPRASPCLRGSHSLEPHPRGSAPACRRQRGSPPSDRPALRLPCWPRTSHALSGFVRETFLCVSVSSNFSDPSFSVLLSVQPCILANPAVPGNQRHAPGAAQCATLRL